MADNQKKAPKVVDLNSPIAESAPAAVKATTIDPTPVEIAPAFSDPNAASPESIDSLLEQKPAEETQAPAEEKKPEAENPAAETKSEEVPAPAAAEQPLKEKEELPKAADTDDDVKIDEPKEEGVDPVLEDLRTKTQAKNKSTGADDVDLVINQVIMGKKEDLIDDMRKFYPDNDSVRKANAEEGSLFNEVTSASMNGWNTGDNNSIENVLKLNDKMGDKLVQQSTCGVDRIPDGMPKRISHQNVNVSGKEARLLLRARLGGLYRVNLLNSGFWVVLRAPQLSELQEIFTTIDIDGKEIGRTIGTHFALISDMFLKKKFVEMLISHKIIIESNFRDIFKNGAFVRNLSFHDYDALMHGLITLMSRNGLRVKLVCPKCGNVSVEQNMDISGAKFVNMNLLTPEVQAWWSRTKDERGQTIYHSEEDLRNYRTKVLGFKRVVTQNVNGVKIDMELTVPTMLQFFQVGQLLIDQLNATINGIANGEADKAELVKASLAIHGYQLTAPWISQLRVFKEDGAHVDMATGDSSVIIEYLDQTIQQGIDNDLFDELHQFVADSRFNYIGSVAIECPKCHAKPESNLDNFFPLEVQTIFFGLLFRLLPAAR